MKISEHECKEDSRSEHTFGERPSLEPEERGVPLILERKKEVPGDPGAGVGGLGEGAGAGRGGTLRGKRIA